MPVPEGLNVPLSVHQVVEFPRGGVTVEIGDAFFLGDADGKFATIKVWGRERADYVALAVNNHAELVELLERLRKHFCTGYPTANDTAWRTRIANVLTSLSPAPAPELPEPLLAIKQLAGLRQDLEAAWRKANENREALTALVARVKRYEEEAQS